AALTREDSAHVYHLGACHRAVGDSLRELQVRVLAAPRVVKRFERRRRGAEQDNRALTTRAHYARVAPVVVGRFLLAIRGLVLFINDDEAEIGDGREDCGARADDDARLSALQTTPLIETLARRQRRMEDRNLIAEVRAKTAREDGRQRDFGYEHHRRAALKKCCAH